MPKYRIALLQTNENKELIESTKKILDKLSLDSEYIYCDTCWESWQKEHDASLDNLIEILKNTTCSFVGPFVPIVKDKFLKSYTYPMMKLRQIFNLHTSISSCKSLKGNQVNLNENIDLVIFRQNTECLYSGVGYYPLNKEVRSILESTNMQMKQFANVKTENIAVSLRIFTREGCIKILEQAFEYAKKHDYKSVTVVEKYDFIKETSNLMIEEARKIAKNYPNIELLEENIDAMCMMLIKNPQDYGIIVSSNIFANIMSNISFQLIGGIGFSYNGNIGDNYAIFETAHSSILKSEDINKISPIGFLNSVKLMLDYLEEIEMANKLEKAIEEVVFEGKVKTFDMLGKNSSLEVISEIMSKI